MSRNLENMQVQGKYTYTIGPKLGGGSFGEVHRVTHGNTIESAMKISLLSTDPLEAFKFAQEAYRTHALKHENIIPIDDLHFFELQGEKYFFFTMPLANHGSLRSLASPGAIVTPEKGVPLLYQSAEGLHHAHTQGVVHRDVKPENILLDERQNPERKDEKYLHVLVSDFGISVYSHTDASFVKQSVGGTLPYMAPEQFEGEPRPESDQYGLSVVAHELFTGQRPYAIPKGEVAQGIQQFIRFKHLHQDASIPGFGQQVLQKNPALLGEIEKIVKKGMSKNPGERYASTKAFGQALKKVLTDYLLSGEAEKPLTNSFPTTDKPSIRPEISQKNSIEIYHGTPIYSVALSPDGKNVASGGEDSTLRLWNLTSGKNIVENTKDLIVSLCWSPDDKMIVSGGNESTVKLWDSISGKQLAELKGHKDYVCCVV